MEEKERYELNDNDCIIDNEKDVAICDVCDVSESPETLVDLLNQQDKHIKELEQDKTKFMDLLNSMTENWWVLYEENKKLRQENKQPKQQIAEKDRKIADLEAKLAESETDKKALISDYESRITKHQELMSWLEHNNEELKQQLAEKDKEIEKLNACVKFYKSYYISFNEKVIDELEKVKRYIDDKAYYVEEENFGIEINEYIDNQINVLRNNKDGIH